MSRTGARAAILGVVVAGPAVGILINYVADTDSKPAFLANPTVVWLIIVMIVLATICLTLFLDRAPDRPGPAYPRFGGVAASLRPPALDRELHGRVDHLKRLRKLSRAPGGRFAVLCGAGGLGKTTTAAAAAKQAQADGLAVFWVRHHSAADLGARLAEIAVSTGLKPDLVSRAQQSNATLTELVWGHLDHAKRPWLVVVDNLDRPQDVVDAGEILTEYRGWIRPARRGLLLITSRDRHPDTWGTGAELMELRPLEDDAGCQVLTDIAPNAGTVADARELSQRLGGLPLALRAAGAMLNEPTSRFQSLASYTRALDDRTLPVLPDRPDASDPAVARMLVGYTWELSLDQLESEGMALARPIQRFLSLFANAPVPRKLIAPAALAEIVGHDVAATAIDGTLAGLHRYGLIDVPAIAFTKDLPTVSVHLVVREAGVALLEKTGQLPAWRDVADRALTAHAVESMAAGRAGWNAVELLAPHIPMLTGLTDSDSARAAACAMAAKVARVLGDAGRAQARTDLARLIQTRQAAVLGQDHPDTLSSAAELARALISLGRYQDALDLEQRTLAHRERVLGPDHPDTLTSRGDLAAALINFGRYDEAFTLAEAVAKAMARVSGPEHPQTLLSRCDLATALGCVDRHEEALALRQDVLTIRERVLGPDHRDTLATRGNRRQPDLARPPPGSTRPGPPGTGRPRTRPRRRAPRHPGQPRQPRELTEPPRPPPGSTRHAPAHTGDPGTGPRPRPPRNRDQPQQPGSSRHDGPTGPVTGQSCGSRPSRGCGYTLQ
ncbi:kinesin light chain-like protein [Alloactinosynnema sp. L-07]|nr:tetratricopeptide repeat protein [Alloactinosynnema sp. L-07]CRK57033.1 kinesin light chain-like protein [Alloactinosynnema sp. L-07]